MAPREQWFPAKGEKGVVGRFEHYNERPDIKKSKAADEFIPLPMVVCRMKVVGDPDESVVPLKAFNKVTLIERFPDAWAAFQGEEVEVDGTPLTELGLSESKILDFRLNGASTVEQVADLSDAQCEAIGFGTRKLREAAQQLMAQQKRDDEDTVREAAKTLTQKKRGRPSNAERAAREAAH